MNLDSKIFTDQVSGSFLSKLKDKLGKEADEYEYKILSNGLQFILDCIEKYRKGKEEHGEDKSGLDYDKEIYLEKIDTFNYECMREVDGR